MIFVTLGFRFNHITFIYTETDTAFIIWLTTSQVNCAVKHQDFSMEILYSTKPISAGTLFIVPFGSISSEIQIKTRHFPYKKLNMKISSVKQRSFCLDLNLLMEVSVPLTILSMLDAPCIDLNSLWMSRRVSCSAAVNCTVARLVRSFFALRLEDVSNVAWDFI